MTRGAVLPLTAAQRATRMRWLAGAATAQELDEFVRIGGAPYNQAGTPNNRCVAGYYRLNGKHDGLPAYNGGKDPAAIDPFDRWTRPGSTVVNRTADCIGGMTWCGGFDRYQPVRFSKERTGLDGWDGWINIDSMLLDARGRQACFRLLDRPEVGCFVVFASGSGGHPIGHIGGVTKVPAEWDATKIACWAALQTVDQAGRTGRANLVTPDPVLWYRCRSAFVVSTMTP